MKRRLIFFLVFSAFLWAGKVEVSSDAMKAEESKKEVHFISNVVIKQQKSWIKGDKAVVYFDENNETKLYEVTGSVTFELKEANRFYKGNADKVTYDPKVSKYVLNGNAMIDDLLNKRHIDGSLITLDLQSGQAEVSGNKKEPVKFIFETQDKKRKKD